MTTESQENGCNGTSQHKNGCNGTSQHKPELSQTVTIDGIPWPWKVTRESLDALKEYDVRDDDVWVVTYPKAGTHWAWEIVQLIRNNAHLESIDRKQTPSPIEFVNFQPDRPKAHPPINDPRRIPTYKRVMAWKSPRTIATHLNETTLPKQIYEGKGKVIYVTRNPKDTAVSLWHFMSPVGKENTAYTEEYSEWNDLYQFYFTGQAPCGSWFAHNLNFWEKHRHDENFLFLKYEDMKKDLRGAVVQIADFIGHPLSDDVIDLVVERSSHENMKKKYHTGSRKSQSDASVKKIGAPYLMRKGIVGDWKSQFTVAQNEAFDKLFLKEMKGSSLHIEFEI